MRTPSRDSSTTSPFSARTIDDAGTPASCASRACAACMRYSPWIGITAFGRTSEISVRSSSARAWPETWTSAFSSCSTSAPRRVSWLIVSCTRSSFPGTGRAERITVSPRSTLIAGWSLYAMRVSADSGSPCEPVHSTSCSAAGTSSTSAGFTSMSSGTSTYPRLRATFRLRRIERPTTTTLRPQSVADVDRLLHPVDVRREARDRGRGRGAPG